MIIVSELNINVFLNRDLLSSIKMKCMIHIKIEEIQKGPLSQQKKLRF